ncbi:MAG: hypothetical protein RL571_2045 [Pseudomonadota bacterium]|jgi:hypothetical protein
MIIAFLLVSSFSKSLHFKGFDSFKLEPLPHIKHEGYGLCCLQFK